MDWEIFRAGVRPGSPTTSDEIKLLLCYILSETGEDMSFAQLNDILTEHELVNYFELVAAADSLLATGHIRAEEKTGRAGESYGITELGRSTTRTIDTMLPIALRHKAEHAAKRLLKREKREREVEAVVTPLKKGYEVSLGFPRGERMLGLKIF